MKDRFGVEILPGVVVAYPFTVGASAYMNIGVVESVRDNPSWLKPKHQTVRVRVPNTDSMWQDYKRGWVDINKVEGLVVLTDKTPEQVFTLPTPGKHGHNVHKEESAP